jgi:hypothetical protein
MVLLPDSTTRSLGAAIPTDALALDKFIDGLEPPGSVMGSSGFGDIVTGN